MHAPSLHQPSTCHPRRLAALLAAAAALLPASPRADGPAPELVAEALFLRDDLPPGGRDLNLGLGFTEGEPDAATGEASYSASRRLQLAMALGERVGFTADVGIANGGAALDTPGASLKLLLRTPGVETTGVGASVDLFGSTESLDEAAAGLGVGAIRSFGRVALRAAIGAVSGVSSWSPHLHGGLSAALALGHRWRVLGEVVADGAGGALALGAGPTVKVTLGRSFALMAGAMFQVEPTAAPTFAVQLTRSM